MSFLHLPLSSFSSLFLLSSPLLHQERSNGKYLHKSRSEDRLRPIEDNEFSTNMSNVQRIKDLSLTYITETERKMGNRNRSEAPCFSLFVGSSISKNSDKGLRAMQSSAVSPHAEGRNKRSVNINKKEERDGAARPFSYMSLPNSGASPSPSTRPPVGAWDWTAQDLSNEMQELDAFSRLPVFPGPMDWFGPKTPSL